jgi:hypothetical protein
LQQKDFLALILLLIALLGGVIATCCSTRLRDICFLVMIFLAPMTEDYDVNFVSRDFYRGTTRGFEVSLVDVLSLSLLISCFIAPRRGNARVFWPASFGFILLFFLYACFNVGMADPRLFGLFELSKMVRGITIFLATAFFVQSERELKLFLYALAGVVCYEGLLGLMQRYRYGLHRVPGTLDDSNSLSVFLCTTAPIFVAAINSRLPKKIKLLSTAAIALACVGVILTISRMGVIIIAVTLLGATFATISLYITARKIIIGLTVIVLAAGVTAKSWNTLKARFEESNLKDEYGNNRKLGRGYYIRVAEAIAEDQTFGVGLNNWSYWVSQKFGPRLGYRFVPYKGTDIEPSTYIPPTSNVDEAQAAPAHSLGALTAGELGIPGLVLFSIVWCRWFQIAATFLWRRRPDPLFRIGTGLFFALSALFLQSLTEWVFRHSPIYYTAHILLGVLAALYRLKRKIPGEALNEPAAEEPEPVYAEESVSPAPA